MPSAAVPLLLMLSGCGELGLQSTVVVEPAGHLDVQPEASTDMGELLPGADGALQKFTLGPVDADPVEVESVWVEGDTGAFEVAGNPSLPRTLAEGQHMGVRVRFRPPESGSFSATFVASTGTGESVRRRLSGKGCADRDDNRRCDE